jgi:uncharacterized membrane protein YbaN (DUF454 family)
MQSIKELLNQGWVSVVIGVVGIVLAFVLYRRSLVQQKLSYVRSSIQLTGLNSQFSPDLKIFFKGRELELVTKSIVTFWNSGNATIEGGKIVATSPLRIVTSEGSEILDAAVSTATREANRFTVKLRDNLPNELECSFDYLDPNDGVIVSVLHTGNWRVNVVGDIQGIPSGPSDAGEPLESRLDPLFWLFITVMMSGLGLNLLYQVLKNWPNESIIGSLVGILLGMMSLSSAGFAFYANKPFREKPPKALWY